MQGEPEESTRFHETLRNKSEAIYRSLVESSKDSIYLLDRNSRYLFANSTYLSRTGLTLDEIVGRTYGELHAKMDDFFPQYVDFVFETGESTTFEYRSFRDDRFFLRTLSPVRDEQGNTIAVAVISKDVTALKKSEQDLRSFQEQLRALAGRIQKAREDERTDMAREIHDELGGALSSLKIDLSLLEKELHEKAKVTDVHSLLEKTKSMTDLITEMATRIREIAMRLRPGILDDFGLVAAIEWQLKDFSKRTGIKGIFLSHLEGSTYDRDISTTVFRIFQEILTNIIRHAHAKNVTVEFKESSGNIVLEVRDDGVGIPEEKILGVKSLGLLGMRERAELFGGQIHFSGIKGKGTTVTVTIPLKHHFIKEESE